MPDWLSPKLAYEIPLWLLGRSQQALFQGAEAGSKARARYAQNLDEQGYSPRWSDVMADVGSLGDLLKGAAGALNPFGEDVRGTQLTEDFTGIPWLDNAIGTGIDLFGDPVNIPVGGAGKILGTMARTAPNLLKLRKAARAEQTAGQLGRAATVAAETGEPLAETGGLWYRALPWLDVAPSNSQTGRTARNLATIAGDRSATWDALNNLGWRKGLLDIPAFPRNELEPLAIRSKGRVNELGAKLFPHNPSHQAMLDPKHGDVNGFFQPDASNLLAYSKLTQRTTVPHEFTHWSRYKTPEPFQSALREELAKLPEVFSKLAEALRKIPAYAKKPGWGLGEEIAARKVPSGTEFASPLLNRMRDQAVGAIQPEMFKDATRIPLELPYMGAKAGKAASQRYPEPAMDTGVVKSENPEGINQVVSYHNQTGERLGHIGYKQRPGRGPRVVDIKMDPKYQKTRYTGEMINRFIEEMGPLINDIGAAGTITNSPEFWKSLIRKFRNHPKIDVLKQMIGGQ